MTHCSRCNILDSTHLKPLSLLLSMLLHVRNQKEKFYYIPSPVKTQLYAFSRSPSKAGNPSSLQVGLTSFTYFHFNGLQILLSLGAPLHGILHLCLGFLHPPNSSSNLCVGSHRSAQHGGIAALLLLDILGGLLDERLLLPQLCGQLLQLLTCSGGCGGGLRASGALCAVLCHLALHRALSHSGSALLWAAATKEEGACASLLAPGRGVSVPAGLLLLLTSLNLAVDYHVLPFAALLLLLGDHDVGVQVHHRDTALRVHLLGAP
mmetsp:Transcript_21060/g.58503  ORF Transcript_21060/g.58503 Transcript_21060/m.58503 type:complete len:264 (-) Transcript_21060:584-1375(-)